jgi:hypothetical protein
MLAASHLDFLRLFPHLPVSGAPASDLGSLDMALMYSHDDRPHRRASANVLSITGITRRLRATFKLIHRQIAAAKINRLRNELRLHADTYADWAKPDGHVERPGTEAASYPQRPLFLGDKWDF